MIFDARRVPEAPRAAGRSTAALTVAVGAGFKPAPTESLSSPTTVRSCLVFERAGAAWALPAAAVRRVEHRRELAAVLLDRGVATAHQAPAEPSFVLVTDTAWVAADRVIGWAPALRLCPPGAALGRALPAVPVLALALFAGRPVVLLDPQATLPAVFLAPGGGPNGELEPSPDQQAMPHPPNFLSAEVS